MNIKNIIRDACFLFCITFWSTRLWSYLAISEETYLYLFVNYVSAMFGFFWVAKWQSKKRFKHLLSVATLICAMTAIEFLGGYKLSYWVLGSFITFVTALTILAIFWLRDKKNVGKS